MSKVFAEIDDKLASWIRGQQMFFVATAPEVGGHINLSPKGPIESLQVLDPHTIAYLDLIGSGAETVAHLRQNGRICVMLCAFQGPPRIVRLHGRGEIIYPADPRYTELLDGFERPEHPESERAIIHLKYQQSWDDRLAVLGLIRRRRKASRSLRPAIAA